MSYQLSLLDKSPIPEGATAAQALERTVLLAQRAEQLGFRRFWVAEHHASPTYAGAAPEVLVAYLLARTRTLRIGSGGVMLQHYSPFKVAEAFRVLAALAPGRVDLGIGKAPGGLPLSTRALQAGYDPARRPSFDALLEELDGWLDQGVPADHPLQGLKPTPEPDAWPQRFLLGASLESAALAARHDWEFSYAGHFNGDLEAMERSLRVYREATGRPASLALYAVAADTQAEAERLAGTLRIFRVTLPSGQTVNVPSQAAAAEFARQAGGVPYTVEEVSPRVLAGTPQQVKAEFDRLSERLGVREFVIDSPVAEFAPRLRSVELIAQAVLQAEAVPA